LACSYNVATVKLLDEIGIDTLPDMARRLGINTLNRDDNHGLALTLGSGEVQLLQLTAAYGAFANGGRRVNPKLIDYIENSEGVVIYRATQEATESILDERVAYLVTDILSDNEARVPAFGEHSVLDLPFPAAVKTGTTTDWRDNWTVGYTTDLVTGVWVGNADNEPMLRVTGVSGAAPIWNAVMRSAHRDPPRPFSRPPGLIGVDVCAGSGLLPGPACSHRKHEIFMAENVPVEHCRMHHLVAFDAATGHVASADCPPERRTLRQVTFWPPEALSWAEEQGLPLPPDGTKGLLAASHGREQARFDLSPAIVYNEPQGAYVLSPDPNSSFTIVPNIPMDYQKIEIAASCPTSWDQGLSLWVDGQEWHTWKGPPYRVFWPLSPGIHEFYVKSGDHSKHSLSSLPIYITVHAMQDEQERRSP